MKLGLVGLPNCGKSTLFNALTESTAESANYPFSTTDKNIGIVTVPDIRLNSLQNMYNAKKLINATIEFVDIAGLVRGAGAGAGIGNKFLGHIREVDGIVHVVRCFEDENIQHVDGELDPLRDIDTINTELIFADLEVVSRRLEKLPKEIKSGKATKNELELMQNIANTLEEEKPVKSITFSENELLIVKNLGLLTLKPAMFVANVAEDELLGNSYSQEVLNFANKNDSQAFLVSAKLEEELVGLSNDQKYDFLKELGIKESSLALMTDAGYKTLNLMSFLTAGPKEVRAWTIPSGTKAVAAAGKIHSDLERGFIRAEIVNYDELMSLGSYAACKDAGKVRLEGKEYIVQEGDIILFRFNV